MLVCYFPYGELTTSLPTMSSNKTLNFRPALNLNPSGKVLFEHTMVVFVLKL